MKRPTIILGAGSVIEIGAPSTDKITEEITKTNKYENFIGHSFSATKQYFTATSKVYELLKAKYPAKPNFEQVFHVLELLDSYGRVWNIENKNPDIYSVIAPFINPTQGVIKPEEWYNLSSLIKSCQLDIMSMINEYDNDYAVKKSTEFSWYNEFWNKFKNFDLFNFNYDTTIERSLDKYVDGFVDSDDERFQAFSPKTLFEDNCLCKICHPHGCIVYYDARYKDMNHDVYEYNFHDLYKWKNYKMVQQMSIGSSGSNPTTQSGEELHIGSIITGLRKTDKLTISPYNYYHHYLNSSVMKNSSLLIIGYSFGDLYVNDLVERMNLLHGDKKRIVVITYIPYDEFVESDGIITKTFHGKDFEMGSINHREFLFFKKMMHDDSFEFKDLDKTIDDQDSFTSDNGQLKLFVYGFKSAVEKHGDEIIKFLTE